MPDTVHWPCDFVAVQAGRTGPEVAHFVAGRAIESPRAGARLVLHAGLDREPLRAWEASGAHCVPAERLLALLEIDSAGSRCAGALELGERYLRAAARLRPHSEVLRLAAEVLPVSEAALRVLLHRTLAAIAVANLGGPGAAAVGPAAADAAPRLDSPPLVPPFDWPDIPPHDLLDRAFGHLHAWQRVASALPFEPRPGQIEMAHAVLEVLLHQDRLVVEAGTGVGKTIAYTLPAVLLAATRGGRFLVSTHTRNLQHQLVGRDLPELWRCFGLDTIARPDGTGAGLRFAKLLGRANYVCRTALGRVARQAAAGGGSFELAQLLLWSLRDTTGELDDVAAALDPRLRQEIASRRESCQGRACRGEPPCPVYAARDTARRADLVVANHALLFSDAASDGSILGPFDAVVLDESHHLEAVATDHLTIHCGRAEADALVVPLGRLMMALRAAAAGPGLELRLERYGRRVAALRHSLLELLVALDAALPPLANRRGRQAYRDGAELFGDVAPALEALIDDLEAAARDGKELQQECAGVDPDSGEIEACLELLVAMQRETRAALEFVAVAGNEDWAFYVEWGTGGELLRDIAAAPLDVAADIQRLIAATAPAAVFTSATLAVGGDFDFFVRRIGLGGATQLVVPSPFDYATQCLVVQAEGLPEWSSAAFEAQVADLLAAIAARAGRRMLVLLTSHAALRRLHAGLLQRLGAGVPILAQEISGSRERVAARFATLPGAVLLGTASFWEGVDFPGQALEVLVIVKLPFLVPDEPLVAARSERMRAHGDDPFGDYLLPEAVLRFKQGFGRLIRSRTDRGAVLLLDSRLGERGYGAAFRNALPVPPELHRDAGDLVARVVGWLEGAS